jgi:hypothetical protein
MPVPSFPLGFVFICSFALLFVGLNIVTPVVVLADYTSEKIDLSDPAIYRDLSKPVGALNPKRLQQFQDRLSSWGDLSDEPPFLYGTHYSSAATVLYYLIRTEPFTSLAIKLQGGRFDVSDRLFYSIPQTFSICLTSTSDVKVWTSTNKSP